MLGELIHVPPPTDAVRGLGEVATTARVGPHTASRLDNVRLLLASELSWLETALAESVSTGVSPGREAAQHLFHAGGKRVRPLATFLAASCVRPLRLADAERVRTVALAAELVHSATLLHDDVIDLGQDRRGEPTSRMVFGNAVSVLAGDLLLTHALELAHDGLDGRVVSDLLRTMRAMVEGEILQLRGRVVMDLSRATYDQIVEGKTASLFAWACRNGARAARADEAISTALGRYGSHLGYAFQIVDDVLDFTGDFSETGKGILIDVAEGKLTLPLLLAVDKDPSLVAIVRTLRNATTCSGTTQQDSGSLQNNATVQQLAAELAQHVASCGGLALARDVALEATTAAQQCLGDLSVGPARDALNQVTSDLAERLG